MNELVRTDESGLWYAEVPRSISKFIVIGLVLLVVCFGGFGVWSFRAPLATAVIGQGSFVATGRNKIVQHLEGGIIENILVTEGESVEAGHIMTTLDQTWVEANESVLNND